MERPELVLEGEQPAVGATEQLRARCAAPHLIDGAVGRSDDAWVQVETELTIRVEADQLTLDASASIPHADPMINPFEWDPAHRLANAELAELAELLDPVEEPPGLVEEIPGFAAFDVAPRPEGDPREVER